MSEREQHTPVCLITGAGSGIGEHTASMLAQAGYRLALVGRTPQKLERVGSALGEKDRDWVALPADLADPVQAEQIVARTLEAFGRIDAVVNNAGSSPLKHVADLTTDEIEGLFALNATAPAVTAAAAVRAFAINPEGDRGGTVVTVSSAASFDPFPGLGVYGAAKASTNTLAKALANEHGDRGVKAYAVAPGAVETPLLRSLFDEATLPKSKTLDPADVARVVADCVLGNRPEPSGETISMPSPS